MDSIQFFHVNYDNHYDHVRVTSGHDIFDQISVFGKYSVHEDRSPRWESIFTLMKMCHVIGSLTGVVQVYPMTT